MHNKINISEIFYSLQGESSYAGFPCVFVRLSGCNLRCAYCDADYTWQDGETEYIDTVIDTIEHYPCDLIEVTGGEPLFQENCLELLSRLILRKKTVLLESNGSFSIENVPLEVIVILDVKCPDSGSKDSLHPDNVRLIKDRIDKIPNSCELKFVLSSRTDYLYAKDFIHKNTLINTLPILFSPVQKGLAADTLADWIMEDGLNVRLQLQLHTILWPGISRGV